MSGGGGVQSIGTGLQLVTSKLAFRRRVLFGILAICMQMTTVIWAADENQNHEPEKSKFKEKTVWKFSRFTATLILCKVNFG